MEIIYVVNYGLNESFSMEILIFNVEHMSFNILRGFISMAQSNCPFKYDDTLELLKTEVIFHGKRTQ